MQHELQTMNTVLVSGLCKSAFLLRPTSIRPGSIRRCLVNTVPHYRVFIGLHRSASTVPSLNFQWKNKIEFLAQLNIQVGKKSIFRLLDFLSLSLSPDCSQSILSSSIFSRSVWQLKQGSIALQLTRTVDFRLSSNPKIMLKDLKCLAIRWIVLIFTNFRLKDSKLFCRFKSSLL